MQNPHHRAGITRLLPSFAPPLPAEFALAAYGQLAGSFDPGGSKKVPFPCICVLAT